MLGGKRRKNDKLLSIVSQYTTSTEIRSVCSVPSGSFTYDVPCQDKENVGLELCDNFLNKMFGGSKKFYF